MAVVSDSDPSSLLCVSSFFHFLFPFFSPLRPPSSSLCLVLSLSNDGAGSAGGGPQLKTVILLPFLAFSIFLLRSVSVFKTTLLCFSTFFSLKSPLSVSCFFFFKSFYLLKTLCFSFLKFFPFPLVRSPPLLFISRRRGSPLLYPFMVQGGAVLPYLCRVRWPPNCRT